MENHNEDYKKKYAQKAKARAEELLSKKNVSVKDYFNAEYFAIEAKNTYPSLEGLTDLLEAIQVYTLNLSKTINGKPDYYKILRADPSMSYQELRKQYKNRSLLVHPDKNKAICATEAFKILSIAIKFLGDETKRADYDRSYPLFANQRQPRHDWLDDLSNLFENDVANNENEMDGSSSQPAAAAPAHSPPPSQYSRGHADHDVPNHNTSNGSTNPGGQPDVPSSSSSHPGTNKDQNNKGRKRKPQVPDLCWTKCHSCKYRFAYPSYFLGRELICCICKKVFLAEEIEAPK